MLKNQEKNAKNQKNGGNNPTPKIRTRNPIFSIFQSGSWSELGIGIQ
jgi:hypothetical protein